MVNVSYDQEKNIYFIKEIGSVSFNEKIELINSVLSSSKEKKELRVLHDMREADYEISEILDADLIELAEHFKGLKIDIKHAAVHSKALGTAVSMLYEHAVSPYYLHKTFSSKEAAVEWLMTKKN